MSCGFPFCEITYSDSLQVLFIQKTGENTLFGFLSLMTHLGFSRELCRLTWEPCIASSAEYRFLFLQLFDLFMLHLRI